MVYGGGNAPKAVIDKSLDALTWLRKLLETGDKRSATRMVRRFAEGLMPVEAEVTCGAWYGEVAPDRVNRRNGYRTDSGYANLIGSQMFPSVLGQKVIWKLPVCHLRARRP